jgi:hypothetical protein
MSRTVIPLALVLLVTAGCSQAKKPRQTKCTAGQMSCSGNQPQTCSNGEWSPTGPACAADQTCYNGRCETSGTSSTGSCNSADEGDTRCDGSRLVRCERSGSSYYWQEQSCSGGCRTIDSERAECDGGTREDLDGDSCSTAGSKRCGAGEIVYECGSDNRYRQLENCSTNAANKYCEESGSDVRCGEGSSATGTTCLSSERDRYRCVGNSLYRCVERSGSFVLEFDRNCSNGGGSCRSTGDTAECSSTSSSGSCSDGAFRCNGHLDCADGADERSCSSSCASENRCRASGNTPEFCLPEERWCDPVGYKDCPGGEDESNCEAAN